MGVILKDIGANITLGQINAFFKKEGSIIDVMLVILGTIMPNQFTTARWVGRQLSKCNISVSKERVSANITHLKRKQDYIKSIQYDQYSPNLIDLMVKKKKGKGNDNPITMIALDKEGRKCLKELLVDMNL